MGPGPGPGMGMTTSGFKIMAGMASVPHQAFLEPFNADGPFDVPLKPDVAETDQGHSQQQDAEEKGYHPVSLHRARSNSVTV